MASETKPTLHHMERSQSQRILWLLEELQIPYNLVSHERIKAGKDEGRGDPELKKTHPLGHAPQLVTPDGRVISESAAIAKYLISEYDTAGKFKGDAKNDEIRDVELSSLASTNLNSHLIAELLFKAMAQRSPFFVRPLISGIHGIFHKAYLGPEVKAQLTYLDKQLEEQDYFMGSSPGRADFLISWQVDAGSAQGFFNLSEYAQLNAWHQRCKARDAWKRAIEKGGRYDLESL